LRLKNWRNFKTADVALRERVYVIGPNASGKSNLLDVFRFLRDVAKAEGGGLQKSVKDRGGIAKVRCLLARKDPQVSIDIEIGDRVDEPPSWRYTLAFKGEGKGLNRVLISKERVEKLTTGEVLFERPDDFDRNDAALLTQTRLEQISTNRGFREVAEFLASTTYLHLVPQLLKHADQLGAYRLESDPFGQAFLERIARTPEKTRNARLRRIEEALKISVPNMAELRFTKDPASGAPHLEALYKHWRPDAGWQREDQFSDGTLRLLGIMWSLLDGDSLLLLEEPELSLNEEIVKRINALTWRIQKSARYRRQVLVTTHSGALLSDAGIDPREILRLEPSDDGTKILEASAEDKALIAAGYSVAEAIMPKVRAHNVDQLALFEQ